MKLGQVFDPRHNALNALRLAMATEVILWHSFALTGVLPPSGPVRQLLFGIGVDGFFAISGFLITASWLNNPRVRDYVVSRALRILPGLYVCLMVTAFVFAPIGLTIQGGSGARLLLSGAPLEYVLDNSAVALLKFDVGGTPTGIPYPGVWNGSLWTLIYEVLCYAAVVVLGLLGLGRRRWTSVVMLALALGLAASLPPMTFPGTWSNAQCIARFAVMFAAGAVVYQWKDAIPARRWLVALSVVIVAASSLLPDYRLIGALPLAYALIVSGALIHNEYLRLPTDLSYGTYIYAFPIQQLLIIGGLGQLNPLVFAVVATLATLPLAALSWFLVERPAQAFKSRLKRRWGGPELAASPA
ncbi:acyltransferase family protein [Mycobacterium sherrisii]|uniref:acyltransferase family protein n=1 Tax=Mycobacterium sherrisii TaxID=243061 RepID=UPI000A15E698|nr:acyltransferase [Mycobacterium sherrisii]MCV7030082.1 acyltransferase [Mycobacterium sherrisii]ORW86576.1 acyltransferase [Mycobacterium sherrisii]